MIKLDILSDPICPWCYIGKARLFQALDALPDHPFQIEWHPFQLNPDMPKGGMERRAYLEGKFGGKEGAVSAYLPIAQTAAQMGLPMQLEAITRTPNTLDAHRLIHWAGLEGRQTPMVQALFDGYFREGRDIGDTATLVDLAASVGLDAALIARLLASDADAQAIQDRDAHARARGVTAVPTFIIANQSVVPGAQPPDFWREVIAEISAQLADQEGADGPAA